MEGVTSIGYEGSTGSYSELALLNFTADTVEKKGYATLKALTAAIESGEIPRGIIPIENSHAGSFRANWDLLVHDRKTLKIVGEHVIREDHVLCALEGTAASSVKRVLSHPLLWDQCGAAVEAACGANVESVMCNDPAAACARVAEEKLADTAVIASKRAAEASKLTILSEDLDGGAERWTRYLIVAKADASIPLSGTSEGRTTVIVSLANRPGSFFRAVSSFALRDVNISRMETRPSTRSGGMHSSRPWEWALLLEFDMFISEERAANAVKQLEEFANEVHVLGSYEQFHPQLRNTGLFSMPLPRGATGEPLGVAVASIPVIPGDVAIVADQA